MNSSELFVPHACSATDALGADAVDQMVSRRRAELARLSLTLRSATSRCEKAETELRAQGHAGPTGQGPSDLLGVVDTMLVEAMAAAADAVDRARREGEHLIERARAEAGAALAGVGIDPARVPLGSHRPVSSPTVAAPPTASQLWHQIGGHLVRPASSAPASSSASEPPPPPPPPPASGSPSATLAGPIPEVHGTTLLLDQAPVVDQIPVVDQALAVDGIPVVDQALAVDGIPVDEVADGQVFELFWEDLPTDRRSRTRFRRRVSREGA